MGDLRTILSDISRDDQRAGEVIRRMRALLLRHEFEHHPLQVNLLTEGVLRLINGDAASRNIEIATKLSPQLPDIQGDRVHLQQVLLNLIMNAMDAVANQPPARRRLAVSTGITTDDNVEIMIADSGCGIELSSLPRLFEPFFTTKETGIGMGLSIADKIVKAHHGRIWAENRPTGGAIFHVVLPASGAKGGKFAENRAAPITTG
jgi:C4-dicarboxylate-specific signal transduction histidine kinase